MKDKIVFWATNEKNQNVLVTLRLRASDNKVDIWMFEKSTISPEFVDKMFEDWANIDVDTLPEPYEYLEHDMSSPSILPDTILANNTEMINRAEKEWYVKILATKLSMKLQEEVVQLVEQVGGMAKYDKDAWELAKKYWDKINQHFQSRDLTREQTASLRDMINKAFNKLKKLRKDSNEELDKKAKENAEAILNKLNIIIGQVADSRNLNGLFDTLKQMQQELRNQRLTQSLNKTVRDKMNDAFQQVKEARRNHRNNRLSNRIKGLESAINRMEKSTRRDKDDLAFQNRRVQASEGKLEKQLREAKIVMIQERLNSKGTKLEDMYKTLKELQGRVKEDEEREAARIKADKQRAEQRTKREASRKAKQAARAKAAEEAKIQKAKEEAEAAEKAKEAALVVGTAIEETSEKAVEIVETVEAKAEAVVEGATEKAAEVAEAVEAKTEAVVETTTEKVADVAEAVEAKTEAVVEATTEKAADVAEAVEAKTETVVEEATEKAADVAEAVEAKTEAVVEAATEKAADVAEAVEAKTEAVVETTTEKVADVADAVEAKTEAVVEATTEKAADVAGAVEAKTEAVVEATTEKAADVAGAVEAKTEAVVEEATSIISSLIPEETPSIEEAEAESLDIDDILSTGSDDEK